MAIGVAELRNRGDGTRGTGLRARPPAYELGMPNLPSAPP
jgi:hypothetical protein